MDDDGVYNLGSCKIWIRFDGPNSLIGIADDVTLRIESGLIENESEGDPLGARFMLNREYVMNARLVEVREAKDADIEKFCKRLQEKPARGRPRPLVRLIRMASEGKEK